MLGTKPINNIEVSEYVNPKQNYWKRVFSVFHVEKTLKRDGKQQIWRNRITLPKNVFELFTYEKHENGCKSTLYWEAKGHLEKRV